MEKTLCFAKKKNLRKYVKYEKFLFWCIVRGDGDSHLGQNGAVTFVTGKITFSVSNTHKIRSCIWGANRALVTFNVFERYTTKHPTRINTYSSAVIKVKHFFRECSLPRQCQLVQIKSQPTYVLCSNLARAVSGLMKKESWIFLCTQWQH